MKTLCQVLVLLLICCAGLSVGGCRGSNDGMSSEQVQKADRLSEIATRSGGDWDKVPQSDRDYLIKMTPSGTEQSARMLLLAKSGKLSAPRPTGQPRR